VSHYAHDFEESARPLIFGGAIPISQRRGTTQCAGRKLAKEIQSQASYSRTLFNASASMPIGQKCHDIDRQAHLYPDTQGLPRLG
jgi:hypothetical protein